MTEPGERIIVVIRRHWLVFALRALILAVAALLPLVIALFVPVDFAQLLSSLPKAGIMLTFLYMLWVLFIWIGAFAMWTNYYLDLWLVTEERLIDVEQRALFRREITTTRLEKIQDVTVNVSGILATLFGFGNLIIHTAGDNPDIVIKTAAHPHAAKEKVLQAHAAAVASVQASPDKVS